MDSNPRLLLCMGGRLGIWEVWLPESGRILVFGGEPEPGFVAELIGGLIGGLPLCLFRGCIGGRGDLFVCGYLVLCFLLTDLRSTKQHGF